MAGDGLYLAEIISERAISVFIYHYPGPVDHGHSVADGVKMPTICAVKQELFASLVKNHVIIIMEARKEGIRRDQR